jgi:hypothetical protein
VLISLRQVRARLEAVDSDNDGLLSELELLAGLEGKIHRVDPKFVI